MLEMRKIDGCDLDHFSTLDSNEKTNAILGDTCWPQTAKQEGGKISNTWYALM